MEEGLEGDLLHVRKVAHIFLCARRPDTREGRLGWCSQKVENLIQLVDVIATLEERLAAQQLSKNAANRPYVNYTMSAAHLTPM